MLVDTIDPIRIVKQKRILTGELPLDKLQNLSSLLVGSLGKVNATIEANEYPGCPNGVLKARLQGKITVSCQRCLGETAIAVEETAHIAPVRPAQEEKLPASVTGWIIDDEQMSLWSILEEFLVLSVPLVPKHSDQNCGQWDNKTAEEETQVRPFEGLAAMIKNK